MKGRGSRGHKHWLPERSCLIRPLLLDVLTGRKSLNQVISGSGLPLAAQSIVAVRERSTTFSWGPMSMVGNPGGSWSSGKFKCTSQTELNINRTVGSVGQSSGSQTFSYHLPHRIKKENLIVTAAFHLRGIFRQYPAQFMPFYISHVQNIYSILSYNGYIIVVTYFSYRL